MNLLQTLKQAGFRGEGLRTAYAIVMRESGGDPHAYNPRGMDKSYGLFQINMLGDMGPARRAQFGLRANEDLFDPVVNARVAYQMSQGGKDFGPWGVGPNAYRNAPLGAQALSAADAAIGGGADARVSEASVPNVDMSPNVQLPGEQTGTIQANPYTAIVNNLERLYATQHVLPPFAPSQQGASSDVQRTVSGSFGAFGKLLESQPQREQVQSVDPLQQILQFARDKQQQQADQPPAQRDTQLLPDFPQPENTGSAEVPTAHDGGGGGALTPQQLRKLVVYAPGADRQGMPTQDIVTQFVGQIAQLWGSKLTIGTGSHHRQYVQGEGHTQSDHWFGDAADIPMTGRNLTRLGQDALIAAGANAKWARKQMGGVFNINGYNILFNTHVGGDHYNHLHVGLGRRPGSRRRG